jgi:hypothetical protein
MSVLILSQARPSGFLSQHGYLASIALGRSLGLYGLKVFLTRAGGV